MSLCKIPYYYFKNALSEQQCNQIISKGLSLMEQIKSEDGEDAIQGTTGDYRQKKAGVGGDIAAAGMTAETMKKKGVDKDNIYVRDSTVSWIDERWVYEMIHPYIHQANREAGWNFDWDFSEPAQFTRYTPGGFYTWHQDSGGDWFAAYKEWKAGDPENSPTRKDKDGNTIYGKDGRPVMASGWTDNPNMINKVRKLSVTINLTNPKNYTGGNLKFDLGPHADKRYHTATEARSKGSIIVFPSHYYHCVTPLSRGTRYSLVMWNLGAPFK